MNNRKQNPLPENNSIRQATQAERNTAVFENVNNPLTDEQIKLLEDVRTECLKSDAFYEQVLIVFSEDPGSEKKISNLDEFCLKSAICSVETKLAWFQLTRTAGKLAYTLSETKRKFL